MSILVTGDFSPPERAEWMAALGAALPGEMLLPDRADGAAEDVDIAIVANPAPGALAGLPRLRLIHSLWAGVEKILADPTVPTDVPLARMVDPAMNEAMAETALWAVLSLHRGAFIYARQQRERQWLQHGQRAAGEIGVTVLGLGEMGRTTALRLARNGYRVTGFSTRPAALPYVRTLCGVEALAQALADAEVLVNLLPLTPATRGLIDARLLARLPRGAALVNLARGAHVVEADLLDALASGQVGHAVLDVFAEEPLPPAHPFWAHERVTVLPHVAAQTDARSAAAVVAENVRALRAGRAMRHLVERARAY
jgi:glyoxylate/hydroxypyruvate reductase A